jgi:uncharacterized protein with FMN-binding domain
VKRAVITLVATVVGVVWLVTFKVTPHARPVAAAAPADTPTPAASPTPSGAAVPTPATAATPTPVPANRPANGSFTGAVISTEFGDVQVRIQVTSGRITDVAAVQMPTDRARSAEITQYVTPVLRSEVIRAQSARIDVISGATFTSEAYAESVYDAMRQDHMTT